MAAEAFKSAGKEPGLQVWRVVKMDLEDVPKKKHGEFFDGDAYVILHTSTGCREYNVHSWAGSNASQDEKGGAAILMMQLDDHLNGKPRQFTEFQNEESSTFMNYFKNGIKYKKGGVASGFSHVVPNEEKVQVVMHLKGRRKVRATEVKATWSSFNSGDCFIIDLGKNIYLWSGSESNRFERLKLIMMGNDIRDNERSGRAEIHPINEGYEPSEVTDVLGPKPAKLDSGTCDNRIPASKKQMSEGSLYLISDAAGSMKETLVAEKNPFKQEDLNPNDCYIVDNRGNQKVFIWKGPEANKDERKAALSAAQKFIKDHELSNRTQIIVMPAGGETTLFKEFFHNWVDKDEISSTVTQMQRARQGSRLFACSNKTGSLIAEEVLGEPTQLDLATDDIMIVDAWDQIYAWIGRDANDGEKAGVGQIIEQYVVLSGRTGTPTTRLEQGQESSEFTALFGTWDPGMWDKDIKDLISKS